MLFISAVVWVGLLAPLVPGPYGAGITRLTRCDTPAKFIYALFAGLVAAMFCLYFLAVRGMI